MPQPASDVLEKIKEEVFQPIAIVIFTAGFFLFVWGLVKFLWNVEGKKEEGKQHMLWGVIGMFVMVSIWAIIALLDNTLGLGATTGGAAIDPNRADQIKSISFPN